MVERRSPKPDVEGSSPSGRDLAKKRKDKVVKEAKAGIKEYFKGVKAEWHKITWPEKNQVIVQTVTTLAVVFFFTTIVYLMDILFKGLLSFIPNR